MERDELVAGITDLIVVLDAVNERTIDRLSVADGEEAMSLRKFRRFLEVLNVYLHGLCGL